MTVDTDELESLRFERGDAAFTLTREGTQWQTEEGAPPDAARLRAMTDRLSTLRARGVESYGESVGAVALRIVATRRPTVEGDRTVTLELGAPSGEGEDALVLARRDGLGVVFELPAQLARTLLEYQP